MGYLYLFMLRMRTLIYSYYFRFYFFAFLCTANFGEITMRVRRLLTRMTLPK